MSEKRYDIDVSRYEGHTPGPWEPINENYGGIEVVSEIPWLGKVKTTQDPPYTVCQMCDLDEEEVTANRNLIADAPKLLTAYQAQAERITKLEAENERLRRFITQAPAEPAKEQNDG